MLFFRKVRRDLADPLASTGLAAVTISFVIFGFLCWDEVFFVDETVDSTSEVLGRVFWWIGSSLHAVFTVAAVGGWVAKQQRNLPLEQVHSHWLVYPIGFALAASFTHIVRPFPNDNPNLVVNDTIANLLYSFGMILWLALFAVVFFTVITGRQDCGNLPLRHGIWLWAGAPAAFACASISLCAGEGGMSAVPGCRGEVERYFFAAILLFCVLVWAAFAGYFGRGTFTMASWIDCFALDMMSASSSMFYISNGWLIAAVLEYFFLGVAAIANLVALLHTMLSLIQRRNVATPEVKLDPLSFSKLIHQAIKANVPTLQSHLEEVNVEDNSSEARDALQLFAAYFNAFRTVYQANRTYKERVIYRACSDFFPEHCRRRGVLAHREGDEELMSELCELLNHVALDSSTAPLRHRKEALTRLHTKLPAFLSHLAQNFQDEEENLGPIPRKYFPLELKKQLAREIWETTPAEVWEAVVPYVLANLPRHEQRIQFLRSLLWSIPERAQQVGAIVYRNVDAVMWERIRVEIRQLVPRGIAAHWKRQH